MGARMQYNFDHSLTIFRCGPRPGRDPGFLAAPGYATLRVAVFPDAADDFDGHEMGHYLACVYYGIDASLPYFLPAPSLTGTFGAFIRIHSQIYSKRVLFDIGIAGPIAGFVFLLPALSVGLALPSGSGHCEYRISPSGNTDHPGAAAESYFPGRCCERPLSASGGSRRLGRSAGHCDEPASDWTVGRRPHSVCHLAGET